MDFCHIAPTKHLHLVREARSHLILAHLVESDEEYADWYAHNRLISKGVYILDNSAFEMYKAGREMYPGDKLIEMAAKVHADYIVMSDYPNEHSSRTIEAALQQAPQFHKAGYGTFFVPQSRIGDIEDYIASVAWAAGSPLVDYIGISILGVPNAYGVEKGNKLQRFMSRWTMMKELGKRGILDMIARNDKKIHFLGMVDGPNEITLCGDTFHIDTWDSSAAVWAGLNGISFDTSPTGLIDGKFEKEVDFDFKTNDTMLLETAVNNIAYIDRLAKEACGYE